MSSFPIFSSTHFSYFNLDNETFKVQFSGWLKKGLVIRLKGGLYILNEADRKIHPSRIFLANSLYSPSYVSTFYALGHYDLVPEKVVDITSVTTKKTAKFENPFGTFIYQKIKSSLFFAFTEARDENDFPVFIAEPEKAVLDFFYLNLKELKNKNEDIFSLSYRFQNLEILKRNKLLSYARRFKNEALYELTRKFMAFIKEER